MTDCVNFATAAMPGGALDLAGLAKRPFATTAATWKGDLDLRLSDARRGLSKRTQSTALVSTSTSQRFKCWRVRKSNRHSPTAVWRWSTAKAKEKSHYRWNGNARRDYQARLAHHNLELKSFCHQSGIHYSLYVNDRDLSDFIFATLPAIGLFK